MGYIPLVHFLPLPLSLKLSAVAMTCLGFDVFVCIVTQAMLPPTSNIWCIILSRLSRCRSSPKKKKRGLMNSYFLCVCVWITVCGCGDAVTATVKSSKGEEDSRMEEEEERGEVGLQHEWFISLALLGHSPQRDSAEEDGEINCWRMVPWGKE